MQLPAQQTSVPTLGQIQRAEAILRQAPEELKLDIEPVHTFGPGFYARTVRIPAGCAVVGKIHATEHVFILSEGRLALASEEGRRVVEAPFQCISTPGVKRAGVALTDCVVTNIHITRTTDLAALEAELIVPEALPYDAAAEALEA